MAATNAPTKTDQELYLDLMKKALTGLLWDEAKLFVPSEQYESEQYDKRSAFRTFLSNALTKHPAKTGRQTMQPVTFDLEARMKGRDWPPFAHTMIGIKRLDNLQSCIEDVLRHNVPGDFIETGVWRGGATIFMRAALQAYGITDRHVWVADSFEGLPPPDSKYPQDNGDIHHTFDYLRISLDEVRANFARYGLLDDQVRFLKGWFKDTLPNAPIAQLAVLRLDGDMYESTMDALKALYPKLSAGGYVIVDDYALKGCQEAVKDYRSSNSITEEIIDIDGIGAFWQRTG